MIAGSCTIVMKIGRNYFIGGDSPPPPPPPAEYTRAWSNYSPSVKIVPVRLWWALCILFIFAHVFLTRCKQFLFIPHKIILYEIIDQQYTIFERIYARPHAQLGKLQLSISIPGRKLKWWWRWNLNTLKMNFTRLRLKISLFRNI